MPRRRTVVRAHAKINLDLRILGRRRDGFHELRTVLQSIDLHDTLTVLARPGPFALRCRDRAVPTDATNLIWRAAAAAAAVTGRGPLRELSVTLDKRIPMDAGLGGGSADAAAMLRALGRFWPDLTPEAQRDLAVDLGADVAFFFAERNSARARTRRAALSARRPADALDRPARSGVRCPDGRRLLLARPGGATTCRPRLRRADRVGRWAAGRRRGRRQRSRTGGRRQASRDRPDAPGAGSRRCAAGRHVWQRVLCLWIVFATARGRRGSRESRSPVAAGDRDANTGPRRRRLPAAVRSAVDGTPVACWLWIHSYTLSICVGGREPILVVSAFVSPVGVRGRTGRRGRRPCERRCGGRLTTMMGRGQVVRRGTLDPVFEGSNPSAPATWCRVERRVDEWVAGR